MDNIGFASLIIIIVTLVCSYWGFKRAVFFEKYLFEIDRILIDKEFVRLISSGFLHVGWLHLFFNMTTLYFFSGGLEHIMGSSYFLLIYFLGLIGGNLFSLFVHRQHGDYSAVGASGAVSGIVFANIALFPHYEISLFVFFIPSWLYGFLFIIISIYGIRSKTSNIGHEAHLAGAIVGMLISILLQPSYAFANILPVMLLLIPSVFFIYMIIKNPNFLLIDNYFFNKHSGYTIDDLYNTRKVEKQREVDRILDKINKQGLNSLTKKEKNALDEFSSK